MSTETKHTTGRSWAGLLSACMAVKARINGEFDHPALKVFGPPLPDTTADVLRIVESALTPDGLSEIDAAWEQYRAAKPQLLAERDACRAALEYYASAAAREHGYDNGAYARAALTRAEGKPWPNAGLPAESPEGEIYLIAQQKADE